MRARRLIAIACVVLTPALSFGGSADDAVAAVKKTLDTALAIAQSPGTREEHLVELRKAARDFLDTRAMGRRAAGDALAAQPAAQQQAFLEVFDELIVRAYLQKLLLFRSPRFTYDAPRPRGEQVIVPTRIVTSKDEYRVDYPMRESGGRWLAYDVVVEDISLTDIYKDQFATLLRDRSFTELIDLMRAKVRPGQGES